MMSSLKLKLCLIVLIFSFKSYADPLIPLRIAHAGGQYQGLTYTNSINALNENKNKFELFEIDFNLTSDGKLVCIHDWGDNFERSFGFRINEVPSYDQFLRLIKANKRFKNCTYESLRDWLQENPGKRIVTDVKDNNIEALIFISKNFPEFQTQFIPQIYHPNEYERVHEMGYSNIIWTLYRFSGGNEQIVDTARSLKLYAVTMPEFRAKQKLGSALKDKASKYTYVHTINTTDELFHYRELGIDEIYTDNLSINDQSNYKLNLVPLINIY